VGLAATPGDGSVKLTWTPPASNGGSAITGYFIRGYLNGANVSGANSGTLTFLLVSGLTNGSTYSFTVQAQNAYGAGPSSSAVSATPAPAAIATPTPVPCGGTSIMSGGQSLTAGQQLSSPNGTYRLVYQTDANLVLYSGTAPVWATGKNLGRPARATMQTDGNFVTYDSSGKATWATGTNGNSGAFLAVQNDGNLVVYAPGCKVLWHR
jgi:hypothetical protein